jgi:hypothetical protein
MLNYIGENLTFMHSRVGAFCAKCKDVFVIMEWNYVR